MRVPFFSKKETKFETVDEFVDAAGAGKSKLLQKKFFLAPEMINMTDSVMSSHIITSDRL